MDLSMNKRVYYVFLLYPDKLSFFFFFPYAIGVFLAVTGMSCQEVGPISEVSYWVKHVNNFKRCVDCR